jgi:hypothetical protein
MTRTLERRLARLEEQVPPDGPPETLEVQFVSADGKVTGTRASVAIARLPLAVRRT